MRMAFCWWLARRGLGFSRAFVKIRKEDSRVLSIHLIILADEKGYVREMKMDFLKGFR